MGVLGIIAWIVFIVLWFKDGIDCGNYIDASKKRASESGSCVYYDNKGNTYFTGTGEKCYYATLYWDDPETKKRMCQKCVRSVKDQRVLARFGKPIEARFVQ